MTAQSSRAQWWLRIATGDLASARGLLAVAASPPRNAAYLAHQVAEKALRASIASATLEPPWTHDLVGLRAKAPAGIREMIDTAALRRVASALEMGRYPDDESDLFDRADAERLVADAGRILDRVVAYMVSIGLDAADVEPA